MTTLRSGREVSNINRRSARRHAPRASVKPRHQQLTSFTRKDKSKANSTNVRSRKLARTIKLAERARNIRRARNTLYAEQARAYEINTGDSTQILGEKRRWLQTEFQAQRILGKPFRELRDFYSKDNVKKPEHRRPKVQSLTDAAKQAKKRLEDVFVQRSHVRIAAGAVDVSNDDVTEDAVQEPSAGEAGLSYYHEEAGSSADRTLPSSPVDNDAAAGQRALALGLVLADYGAMDQGNGSHGGSSEGGEEVQVKEEEQ